MSHRSLSIIALALFGFAASPFSAAATLVGSGRSATEERQASGFSGIALSLPARVEVVQGATEGVTLTADDNVLAEIEAVVERGILHLRWRNRTDLVTRSKIRIAVRAKSLESLSVAGAGDFHVPAIATPRLAVKISGSGDVSVAGRADELEVRISGSGDVKAGMLETRRAQVSIAGSGDATVWARQALKVSVAGSGDIRYYGDPSVEKSIAGSGSVRRLGAAPA
jgi:hypothetical protein